MKQQRKILYRGPPHGLSVYQFSYILGNIITYFANTIIIILGPPFLIFPVLPAEDFHLHILQVQTPNYLKQFSVISSLNEATLNLEQIISLHNHLLSLVIILLYMPTFQPILVLKYEKYAVS